jgi:signal transduction histidine kinase
MKTPVSIINLILQDQNKEENKELFISLSEENDKISQGLDMMLYNARLQEFNHDFSVEALNLNSLVRKVTNNNKKALIRNSIFPKITGESTEIKSDNKWLSFVINQIVINAIKYTKVAKRAKRTIIFTISEETSKFVLSIEDNGIGIPKEDLDRVFNAFFTGKNGRKTSESTGMGMYLSKKICTELGHELTVEAEEGKGTIFHITFYKEKNIFKF